MERLSNINRYIGVLFTICYLYQFIYIFIVLFFEKKEKTIKTGKMNRYAILICARNEETVIKDLIRSCKNQSYSKEYFKIFVLADNCNDHTYEVSKEAGAIAYQRFNAEKIGKGYALEELLKHISEDYPNEFDAYIVFDADNLLAKDYLEQMNQTFNQGYEIITSYRNSKNYGTNWISAGYALWFLRESKYLNYARYLIDSSCAVSGTGFLFSQNIADEICGWPYHLLTEDIEFSIDQIIKGKKIGFCKDAELFDEQPAKFSQSWNQRMRWSKGFLQVFFKYGKDLIKGTLKGDFSCYDMTMTIMPAYLFSIVSIIINISFSIYGAVVKENLWIVVSSIAQLAFSMMFMVFVLGVITTITEWNHIHAKTSRKIISLFTFPLFMATYIPISFVALFHKTTWKPIKHEYSLEKIHTSEIKKITGFQK